MVTVISSCIIYYMASHIHLSQPHMPTPQGFQKKCPHLQLRVLFRQKVHNWDLGSYFRIFGGTRHPKFFWCQNSQQSKHQKTFSHKIKKHVVFFRKSMMYIQKPKSRIPMLVYVNHVHLSPWTRRRSTCPTWWLKSQKLQGRSMDEEPLIRWSWNFFPQESKIKRVGMFLKPSVGLKKTTCWSVGL